MRQVDCCRPHPPFPALATTWGLPVTTPPRRGGEVLGIQAEDELPGTARQSAFARQQFLADHDAVGGGLW